MKTKITIWGLTFFLGFVMSFPVLAASTPNLGTAGTFGILSSTFTRNIGATIITGDVGYTTLSGGGTDIVSGITYMPPSAQVGNDQATLVSALASEPCTFTFIGALHLGSDTTHGPLGIYTPGVYCSTGAMDIDGGATITLSGNGTYIFRSGGALDTTANSVVALNNSSACDIFWTAVGASTFGANSTFIGTDIDDAGITIGNMVSWSGRALSFASTITADTDTITVPACSVPVIPATPSDPTLASGSTHRGGTTHYGCKDPSATNYEYFSASRPSLCIYNSIIAPSALISIPLVLATSTPNFPDTGFAPEKSFLSTNILCQEKSSQK